MNFPMHFLLENGDIDSWDLVEEQIRFQIFNPTETNIYNITVLPYIKNPNMCRC